MNTQATTTTKNVTPIPTPEFETIFAALRYWPVLLGLFWMLGGILLGFVAGAPGLIYYPNIMTMFPEWVPTFIYNWIPGLLQTGGYLLINLAWVCVWGMVVIYDNRSFKTWAMFLAWGIITFFAGTPIWIMITLVIAQLLIGLAADQLEELSWGILPHGAMYSMIAAGIWFVAFMPWRLV